MRYRPLRFIFGHPICHNTQISESLWSLNESPWIAKREVTLVWFMSFCWLLHRFLLVRSQLWMSQMAITWLWDVVIVINIACIFTFFPLYFFYTYGRCIYGWFFSYYYYLHIIWCLPFISVKIYNKSHIWKKANALWFPSTWIAMVWLRESGCSFEDCL